MAADRVTDEMVASALKAWQETNVTFGDLHSLMRAALTAALRAEAGAVVDGVPGWGLIHEDELISVHGDPKQHYTADTIFPKFLRGAVRSVKEAKRQGYTIEPVAIIRRRRPSQKD